MALAEGKPLVPDSADVRVQMTSEERLEVVTVGVDIGSATSQLAFSRVTLEKQGNRYLPVARDILFESAILLTPYAGPSTIDAVVLGQFVDAQYADAGIARSQVDAGALILTGVALDRKNSRLIADTFAAEAGRMVAVSAGDSMEAMLAAHGSGAVARSRSVDGPLLHVDIGGGTTKLAVCRAGRVVETLAIDVGARLIVTNEDSVVTRMEAAGQRVCELLNVDLAVGQFLPHAVADRVVRHLADAVLSGCHLAAEPSTTLFRGAPLASGPFAAISFSGGVAEYIYQRETRQFEDLGFALGVELADRISGLDVPLVDPGNAGVRATVVGASQFTVQVSGSTIHLSDPAALPIRNVQVVAPSFDFDPLDSAAVKACLDASLSRFDLARAGTSVAVSFAWEGQATYQRIDAFARGVVDALGDSADGSAIVLVSAEDVGGLIGRHISNDLGLSRPVVSIDCVDVEEFEFVDVGALIPGAASVPVVIKSLLFPRSISTPLRATSGVSGAIPDASVAS